MKKDQESLPSFGVLPQAVKPWRHLCDALDALRDAHNAPPCQGPNAAFWTSDSATERRQAAALCDGCPIGALCGEYAAANTESWGVWNGRDLKYPAERRALQAHHQENQ